MDRPTEALGGADRIVQEVMKERGYPVDDFEQRSADLSVDPPPWSPITGMHIPSRSRLLQAMRRPRTCAKPCRSIGASSRSFWRDSGTHDAERDEQEPEKDSRAARSGPLTS